MIQQIINNLITDRYYCATMNQKWSKPISNPIETPWFTWIQSGEKKYEGRIRRGDWKKIKIGDEITFTCEGNSVVTLVTELIYYNNFRSACEDLGTLLVPHEPSLDKREACYTKIYHKTVDIDNIEKKGVVAVGLSVIN